MPIIADTPIADTPIKASRPTSSRDRIVDSAARCFAKHGFRKTRFEEIAAGAGVSRTLLYSHFENKLEILRAVRDQALQEWVEAVAQGRTNSDTARATLHRTVRGTLLFASSRPIFRAFLSDDAHAALLGEPHTGVHSRAQWRDQTLDILQRGVQSGEFAADLDLRATADVLCAMQLGMIERMHRDTDTTFFVTDPTHIDTACRILIDGVVGARTAS